MIRTRIGRLGIALLGASLLMGSAAPAFAKGHRNCEQKIRKDEAALQNAIHRHGEHSRQAEKKRLKLEEARNRCGR